jgi:hypothetical protein
MISVNKKDLLISLLVAYVTMDLLLAYAMKMRHPGVFETLKNSIKDENAAVVIALGVGAGVVTYFLAKRSREMFSIKN